MSETFVILKREFLERVRTKSFVISTLLFPVFMAAMLLLPAQGGGGGGDRDLVLVDEAPAGVGDYLISTLSTPAGEDAIGYRIERAPGRMDAVRDELSRRVQAREIDGYIYLPPDILDRNEAVFRAHNIANFDVLRDIRRAASDGVQAARLMREGLELGQVMALVRPVELQTARITSRGEEGADADTTFVVAFVVAFLIYFMLIFYGMNVMRSVLEEKTSRIAEVLVSSVDATRLMLGKIIGVACVALFQVGIWAVFVAIALSQSDLITRRFGVPPEAFSAMRVDPWVGASLLTFFLLGFFLYAAVYAALGAAVTSEQEAQQLQVVVLLPLIVPIMLMTRIAGEPLGTLATVLGMVPFSSPLSMPFRMAATSIPIGQVVASLLLLAATAFLLTWLAGKIYRVGILSTGKRPTLREVGHWLRAA